MFEQLFGKLPVGICIVNEDYQVIFLNDFFANGLLKKVILDNEQAIEVTTIAREEGDK